MKKGIILSSAAALLTAGLLFTGCSKDDTAAPSITLKGSNPDQIVLNSGTYTDPGATATDDEDGTISYSSTYSSSNPDVTTAGAYTITYTASDKAGNSESVSRTVNVIINRTNYIWSNYNCEDTCNSLGTILYSGNISAASAADQIVISNFSGLLAPCTATVSGSNITIASQVIASTHTIVGSGTINNKGKLITINYTDNGEAHIAVFTKL